MLDEKLARASKQTKRGRFRTALACLALFGAAVLVLLTITLFDMLRRDSGAVNGLGSAVPDGTSVLKEGESAAPEDLFPLIRQDGTTQGPDTTTHDASDREAFMSSLREFEETVEPSVRAAEFASWNPDAQQKILQLRQDSLDAFARGNYGEALNLLADADDKSRRELQAKKTAYDAAIQATLESIGNDDHDAALQSVTEALQLDPRSTEASALKQAVDDLPAVLALLAAIDVARVENDWEAEVDLINQVLALDPGRQGLGERAETLRRKLRDQRFSSSIADGMRNIERRNLKAAEDNLARAVAIDNTRPEVAILSGRIASLRLDLKVERLLGKAEEAGVNDQWQQASVLFGKAKDLQPANRKAVDGYALASAISHSGQTVTAFLSAPHRLSSPNVAKLARSSLEEGMAYISFSRALNSKLAELDRLITLYGTPVAVQVLSDGLTEVAVRGVGRVGKIQSKMIHLNPGTYSFEGKRAGFRTVLVKVEVPPGASDINVRIVCDEQV